MRAPILALLLLTVGCLGSDPAPLDLCQAPELVTFGPEPGADGLPRAPGETVPVLAWMTNPTNRTLNATLSDNRSAIFDPLRPGAGSTALTVQLAPNETGFGGIHAEHDNATLTATLTQAEPCQGEPTASEPVELAEPTEAERGEGGRGVLVHTVGWWTNGSSFYTNLDRYHDDPATPKGYADYSGGEALPVYVYNESGEEMPPRYERAGYVTTIPGFNEALKGIPTTGALLAYLEPEQAYTRPGNEDHPLYGDVLIFYIEAVEVTTVPCEVPQPVCDIPREPEPPEPPEPFELPAGAG